MTSPTRVGTPADAPVTPSVLPHVTVYPATEDGVLQALTDLGDTAEAIAAALLTNGYTGRTASASYCPIARYLSDTIPGLIADSIQVGTDDAGLWTEHGHSIDVDLPAPVVTFVTAFDCGAYPELVSS